MFQFLPVAEKNIIAVRASGKLSHEDYQAFLPVLEKKIIALEKPSILFELDNFQGWSLQAAKDDFNFAMEHMGDFERVAIVGDKAWEHWMVAMIKPFLPFGRVHYFDRDTIQQAWRWLREPMQRETAAKQLKPYQSIVVAVDFSIYSKHAAKRALELAQFYQTDVTLLHIVEETPPYYGYGDNPIDVELLEKHSKQQMQLAKEEMQHLLQELNESDTTTTIHSELISGNADHTMLSFIQAKQVDLIVFGSKKKTGIDRLLGSVPHYIQNHADCEVLIVPLQDSASFTD